MVRASALPKGTVVQAVKSPSEGQYKYICWNWVVSFIFFAIFYYVFLYAYVVGTLPSLDVSWSIFLAGLWTNFLNFLIQYGGCLLAGIIGSVAAMGITGYNAYRGGVYGVSRLLLGNLVFTVFVFFGLFLLLTSLGWFWAVVIYGLIKLATVGWVEASSYRAGNAVRHRLTKMSERVSGVK